MSRSTRHAGPRLAAWVLVGAVVGALVAAVNAGRADAADLEDWAVADGYSLDVVTTGLALPTALAVVPEPGDAPDDPMLYVVELRGAVKALTNAGELIELTSMPTVRPPVDEMAHGDQQSGMAGVCLAPDEGMVVATFVYPDEEGVLRNDLVLLDTGPTLSTTVVGERRLTELFAEDQSVSAHQIGGCQVVGERLYVGIGDGGNPSVVSDPDVLLGKVLCLLLDGSPCPDNPWHDRGGRAAYVLATGFRNPFGLHAMDEQLFAAENGVSIDRFLRVRAGSDHLWNGSDTSIATGAEIVFDPAVSPVQLDHIPGDHALGELWGDHFVLSVFNTEPRSGVMGFRFDRDADRVASIPRYLVQYVGEAQQHVVAMGVGPDGLYFAGALPGPDGSSALLRVHPDGAGHPVEVVRDWGQPSDERFATLQRHGCVSCHAVEGVGAALGPSLDRFSLNFRLGERLNADGYERRIEAMNAEAGEDEADRVAAREAVLEVSGRQRIYVWLEHYLQDPRFDDPDVTMPDLGLSPEQAREIRDVLVADQQPPLTTRAIRFARDNQRGIAAGFVAGGGSVMALVLLVGAIVTVRRRRRTATRDA